MLDHVRTLTAHKTDDSRMGTPKMPAPEEMTITQTLDYLTNDPRHALVIVDVDIPTTANVTGYYVTNDVAVFRGASGRPDNYYVATTPMEDPGDVLGGCWDAQNALTCALHVLCG